MSVYDELAWLDDALELADRSGALDRARVARARDAVMRWEAE